MSAHLLRPLRLICYYLVAALGYGVGLVAALIYTVALWFVGAVLAGYRAGRG